MIEAKFTSVTVPDRANFINPWNVPALMRYFTAIRDWHGYIRFLGLPHLRDNPDIPISKLYIEPLVAESHIHPDMPVEKWPVCAHVLDALLENPRLVLLGDPGSGKSTLINWLAWQFARPEENGWTARFGPLVPLPLILREIPLDKNLTWDRLLKAFLDRPASESLKANPEMLDTILSSGQALLMFDGVDEIGSLETREALRRSVFEGMDRYPACRLIVTSRIVGYDAAPYAIAPLTESRIKSAEETAKKIRVGIGKTPERAKWLSEVDEEEIKTQLLAIMSPYCHERYLVPLQEDQIAQFARNWYYVHEADAMTRDRQTQKLIAAIQQNEGTKRLARIPNLLTMMALIHRVRAELPHGRARLYDDIAEAYLESIDKFRGLRELEYKLEEKREWLAKVGYEMQRRRASKESEKSNAKDREHREILVAESEIVDWIADAMTESGRRDSGADKEARDFVDHIARRSGLLIPRGEGLFAFVHLSFQEYFAAYYLKNQIMAPRWLPHFGDSCEQRGGPLTPNELAALVNQSTWRETFCLLFELLPTQHRWPDEVADWLFGGKRFERLIQEEKALSKEINRARVFAAVAVDPYSGLSETKRREILHASWRWEFSIQHKKHDNPLAGTLTSAPDDWQAAVWQAFSDEARSGNITRLSLQGCDAVVDLSPLVNLKSLKELSLGRCTGISDLSPLANLTSLEFLFLEGCTGVSDLSALATITALEWLSLDGCTGVSDLSALANVTILERLSLDGCTGVSDLSPLAHLSALTHLSLRGCMRVSDLSPLANVTTLEWLSLDGCTGVPDLSALANITALEFLSLNGCAGVSDLSALAHLSALKELYLGGCTGVSDLSPLANLTVLTRLSLFDFTGITTTTIPKQLLKRKGLRIYRD